MAEAGRSSEHELIGVGLEGLQIKCECHALLVDTQARK